MLDDADPLRYVSRMALERRSSRPTAISGSVRMQSAATLKARDGVWMTLTPIDRD